MFYDIMSIDMDTKFPDWLMKIMRQKNLTQASLSRASGLTRQAIGYYLSGKSKHPEDDALRKLANGLNLPTEEIYRAAGMLAPKPEAEEDLERGNHYLGMMRPATRKNAINLLEFLVRGEAEEDAKSNRRVTSSKEEES